MHGPLTAKGGRATFSPMEPGEPNRIFGADNYRRRLRVYSGQSDVTRT